MAQRDLAPASAHFRAAQCLDEVLRFFRERALAQLHGFELLANTAVRFGARFFEFANLLLRLLQRIAYGFHEVFDGLLTFAEFTLGAFLVRGQVLLGQAQEVFTVGLQALVGEIGKRCGQPAVGSLECEIPFALQRFLILDTKFEFARRLLELQPPTAHE